MSNNGEKGFCILSKKIKSWCWYKNNNTKSVFIHCLIEANYKDNIYRGVILKRGQFITSQPKLAEELGLSKDEIRTALKHLQDTKAITTQPTKHYTIITVNNYDSYQKNPTQNPTQFNSQNPTQTTSQNSMITDNNYNLCQKIPTQNAHSLTHKIPSTNNINNNINTLSLTKNDFKNYKENVYLTNKQYNDLLVLTGDETILNQLISDLSNNIDAAKENPFNISYPKAHFARLKKYYEQTQKNIRKDNNNEQYKQEQSESYYTQFTE